MSAGDLRYVGDLSRDDAALLARFARAAGRILEFGVGASTQIFAQAAPARDIVSLDRSEVWIARTRALLAELAPNHGVKFVCFARLSALDDLADESFDLIFDDGDAELRLEFALAAWRLLTVGGHLILHDTRRPQDMSNALAVAGRHFREIDRIDVNPDDSHLTVLRKCAPKPYANWNKTEGRASWQVGDEDLETTLRNLRR